MWQYRILSLKALMKRRIAEDDEVGYDITAADDVMATGFNWCPPLAMYRALSTVADVPALIKERLPEICQKIDVDYYLADIKASKYDYRIYFKSGRKN